MAARITPWLSWGSASDKLTIKGQLALFCPVVESDPRRTDQLLALRVLAGLCCSGVLLRYALQLRCWTVTMGGHHVSPADSCAAARMYWIFVIGAASGTSSLVRRPAWDGLGRRGFCTPKFDGLACGRGSAVLKDAGVHPPDVESVTAVDHRPAHAACQADPDNGAVGSEVINPAGGRDLAGAAQFNELLTPEVLPLRHPERLDSPGRLCADILPSGVRVLCGGRLW